MDGRMDGWMYGWMDGWVDVGGGVRWGVEMPPKNKNPTLRMWGITRHCIIKVWATRY